MCGSIYLLLAEFLLDFLLLTGVVDYRSGQLHLYVRQPGTQAAHLLFQLLNSHEGLPQLLHPDGRCMSWRVITKATLPKSGKVHHPPTIVCDTPEFRGIMQRRKHLNKKRNLFEVFGRIHTVDDNTGCCLS